MMSLCSAVLMVVLFCKYAESPTKNPTDSPTGKKDNTYHIHKEERWIIRQTIVFSNCFSGERILFRKASLEDIFFRHQLIFFQGMEHK